MIKRSLPVLPNSPGVYLMRDNTSAIIYIGKAKNLKKRVASYFLGSKNSIERVGALVSSIQHIDYVPTASEIDALVLERRLINQYKPNFNVMWKDDKSYPYVKLTLKEDFPRLLLTRHKERDGSIYFGPYPNVRQLRHFLKWIWRKKFFALRPCKLEVQEGHPYPYEKVKSCLYLHTKECPAPCLGHISSVDYKKIAERARWFFSGQKSKVIEQWEKEMAAHAKKLNYEEAAAVRNRIDTLKHMDERVTFGEVTESMLDLRINESRATQDLMKGLGLKKPPENIECFDISHFQGTEKVGSMIRFEHGRPNKSQYRKFIIRSVEGIDDFKAMAEVVGRRYRRLRAERKTFPDLVLIDGGKGQLSAALNVLKEEKISGLEVAALAKQEEEVFRPGEKNSIRLPQDSAGLLLLRQIRDEAHRFAITFHRLRRDKKTFEKGEPL